MTPPVRPIIVIYPHAGCGDLDLVRMVEETSAALPFCLDSHGSGEALLGEFDEIEVSLVSDEVISGVHGEFMEDPTPTDVITFHHGEIIVSLDTARREGPRHGNSFAEETLLYIIHGLLHLNGHTDLLEPDRTAMHRVQESILARVLRRPTTDPDQTPNR